MEEDNNPSRSAGKGQAPLSAAEPPQPLTGDALAAATAAAAAAHIEVRDFSVPRLSDDGSAHGEQGGEPQDALGHLPPTLPATADLGPGFVDINGDVGGIGHNETEVDVIAVPCPGADPVNTWTYSQDLWTETDVPGEAGSRTSLRIRGPWVTKNLRRAANIARVFLYRHRELEDGMTLESLAKDLLNQVEQMRKGVVRVSGFSSIS